MSNPFEEISQKLDTLISRIDQIQKTTQPAPTRQSLPDFCRSYGISRPTAVAWAGKKLIQIEKIEGRNFVKTDSVTVTKKYQRRSPE